MTLHVRDGSGQSTIGNVRVRDGSGLSAIGQIRVRDATNTLIPLFNSFSASASPTTVVGSTNSQGTITVSTGFTTVTPNPAGPAAHSWSSPDPGWTAVSPTSATTQFRYSGLGPGDSQSTTFTDTVTRGTATVFVSVVAQVDNYGLS